MIRHAVCVLLTTVALAACTKSEAPTPAPATRPAASTATPIPIPTAAAPAMPTVLAAPSAEGFLLNWLILDPIAIDGVGDHSEEVEKPMFAKEYFKDQLTAIPHDKDQVTVAGKSLVWHKFKAADDQQVDLAQFCTDHNTDPTSCLFFGFTYVIAPDDMKAKLSIGSDDSSVWWLNGEEVVRAYSGRAVNPDDDSSKEVTLKKGLNTLRFAVIQGDGPTGAGARFYDKADKVITSIKIGVE